MAYTQSMIALWQNAKDVQQRRLREVLLRLPDRMDAARDVDSGVLFEKQCSLQGVGQVNQRYLQEGCSRSDYRSSRGTQD